MVQRHNVAPLYSFYQERENCARRNVLISKFLRSIRTRAILPARNIQKHNTTYVVQPLWRTSTVKTIPKVNFRKEGTRDIVFGSGRSRGSPFEIARK